MILWEAAPQTVSRCLEARPGAGRGPSTSDKEKCFINLSFQQDFEEIVDWPKKWTSYFRKWFEHTEIPTIMNLAFSQSSFSHLALFRGKQSWGCAKVNWGSGAFFNHQWKTNFDEFSWVSVDRGCYIVAGGGCRRLEWVFNWIAFT